MKISQPKFSRLSMPRNLTLIRHGENIDDFSIPNHTLPLSAKGIETIEMSRDFLFKKFGGIATFYDMFLTSPYIRARQTGQILSPETYWSIDGNLSERNWGEYGALAPKLRNVQYPEVTAQLKRDYYHTRPPGGESITDVWVRQKKFLESIEDARDKRYLISTHGGFMKAFQLMVEGCANEGVIENGEIWIYENDDKTIIKPSPRITRSSPLQR